MKGSLLKRFSLALVTMAALALACGQVYAQNPPAAGGTTVVVNPPASAPAPAPPAPPPPNAMRGGDNEVFANANLNIGMGDNIGTTTGSGNFMVGHFFSSRWEGGLGLFFDVTSDITEVPGADGNLYLRKGTVGVIGPMVFGRYNWRSGPRSLTYVGVDLGVQAFRSNADKSGNDWLGRPHVGYKYFFRRNTAFDVNLGYKIIFSSAENSVQRSDSLDFRLGLAFVF